VSKALLLAILVPLAAARYAAGATYYVRQTTGDDARDGTSPQAAWQHVARLSAAMRAGDTAYVGPGLYREEIDVLNEGTPERRLVFVADTTGQHTGDPPGVVMITGADPVGPAVFVLDSSAPGVYTAHLPYRAWGAVEMSGPQYRYGDAGKAKEHVVEKRSPVEVVAKLPSTYFYDEATNVLYLHTSDGRPPASHEIEIIRRGNGISMVGKHYVTVMGFTFRNMQDSGINFFKGSGDGIAINNTSWGSRQGIRVYGARNVLVYGNTLFRNENCGVYFAAESANGVAIGNTAYENVKGLRWSSDSVSGLAIDNVVFDNHERGIAIERADRAVLGGNRLVDNVKSQLLIIQTAYSSESNCFQTGGPEQLVAEFFPYLATDRYRTLAEYQGAKRTDLHSHEGGCDPPPAKLDVRKLHAESTAYADRARRVLSGGAADAEGGTRGWLDWLLGR
jgi:parallel beta-helix repeat protein